MSTDMARLGLDTREERASLAVLGPGAVVQHSTALHLFGAQHHDEGPERDAQDEDLRALADEELHAHGWVRSGPWATGADPRAVVAPLRARDRHPIDGPTQAVLDALWDAWPPAPAREVAEVAGVSPRAARGALARLVVAGHVRCTGRTAGPRPVDRFAPVGTQWAPDRAQETP